MQEQQLYNVSTLTPDQTREGGCAAHSVLRLYIEFAGRLSSVVVFHVQVVEAKLQQITMTEFLPALGITESDLRNAPAQPNGTSSEFVTVEFATAAFRFGHDLVPDMIGQFKTADIFNGQVCAHDRSTDTCVAH